MERAVRERHTPGRTISIPAILVLVAGILAVTASPAAAAACMAKDGMTSSSNLQTIIDGASSGDTILIKGTCVGNFLIPGAGSATNLSLEGNDNKGMATLDGNGAGSVLAISSGNATIANLLIRNGNNGIFNSGTLGLRRHTVVSGNTTDFSGGGIYNSGTLNMRGDTTVTGNTAYFSGGGIYNSGTLNMSDRTLVAENAMTNDFGGGFGGGIDNAGFATLNMSGHATVTANTADQGAGIQNQGTLKMTGRAAVSGNTADYAGGGIYNDNGAVAIAGNARVNGNTAFFYGGGIRDYDGSTLTMSGKARVNGNTADKLGGGIYHEGGSTLTMSGKARVNGNTAIYAQGGGGIYNDNSTLVGTVAGVNVRSNTPDDIAP